MILQGQLWRGFWPLRASWLPVASLRWALCQKARGATDAITRAVFGGGSGWPCDAFDLDDGK